MFAGDFLNAYNSSWDLAPDGRLLLLKGAPPVRLTRLEVLTDLLRFLDAESREAKDGK